MRSTALDENDGPHLGGCKDCRGVVTIDSRDGKITRNEEYYALAHASRFVRPGARRIASTSGYDQLDTVAFRNAARVLQETGATAVKLEGGTRMADTIQYLTQRGIPVMGHIGLTPQMVHVKGGFRTTGREESEWPALLADAKAVSDAGAFSVVLEGMAEPLAARITREIPIPTIGIGASPVCDGQVLVMEDMLGLNPNPPKFVRQYAQLGPAIEAAVQAYAKDVRERRFPGEENVYPMKKAQS